MTELIVQIGVAWLVAILAGLPLFASMGLAAFAFVLLADLSASIVAQKMAQSMNSFPIIAAPLFILMGNILGAARITDRIVEFASAVIGWVRGGYAHASILTSMIFAGMVGSAVADAAGSGAIEIRAMRRAGYKPETAAAQLGQRWNIDATQLLQSPYALVGSVDTIVNTLQQRHEEFGATYFTRNEPDMEALAPVVRRLV